MSNELMTLTLVLTGVFFLFLIYEWIAGLIISREMHNRLDGTGNFVTDDIEMFLSDEMLRVCQDLSIPDKYARVLFNAWRYHDRIPDAS